VARIEVIRHIGADPAGVALLLAGPAGRELWGEEEVVMTPPERSGVGFRIDFQLPDRGPGSGQLLIAAGLAEVPADALVVDAPLATEVRLSVSLPGAQAAIIGSRASEFLDRLAVAAQARSSAA
jgi:hypothetical protein